MKKVVLLLSLLTILYACTTNTKEQTEESQPIAFQVIDSTFYGQQKISSYGDTLRQAVSFRFPLLVENNSAVYQKINQTILARSMEYITTYTEEMEEQEPPIAPPPFTSLRKIADDFFKEANEIQKEDSLASLSSYSWTFDFVADTLYLTNNTLTYRLDYSIYTGGAHPNSSSSLLNFDLKTGEEISIEQRILDKKAFSSLLESHFIESETKLMKEEGQAFNKGDYFLPEGDFPIPSAMGFSKEGLYCIYVPYEIAPYVRGSIEFVIPYEKLKGQLKM